MVAEESFILELTNKCACEGCMPIVEKVLKKAKGVHKWKIVANECKIRVSGTVEPHQLIAALEKKHKQANLSHYSSNITTNTSDDHQLQINVPAKLLQGGVLHDNAHSPPQLHQLSQNNQGIASDDKDADHDDDSSIGTSTTKENQISHSFHEHELEFKNYNKPFKCNGCKEPGFGPRFKCESCEYELHKECKDCLTSKPEISHENFKGCTFKFFDQLPRKLCDACGKDICGFLYHSQDGKWDLHPCCSKLENKICIDGNYFELRDKVSSKCTWCNKKNLQGTKTHISGWSYVCARKGCHFHVHCVTEMVDKAWKQGLINNINADSMALQKIDPQVLLHNSNGKRESDQISGQTTKMFLKAVIGVLLGDPTMIILSVLVNLLIS